MREPQDTAPLGSALRRAAFLGISAGYADAFGYFHVAHVFSANMTGNTVFLGTSLVTGLTAGDWDQAAKNAIAIGAFFIGAVLASLLRQVSDRSAPGLVLAAALLVPLRLVRLTALEQLVLLASAMGAQGASLSRFGKAHLQTVVVTGTLLHLADAVAAGGRKGLHHWHEAGSSSMAVLALGSWLAYGAGAALGGVVPPLIALPLAVPIAMLLLTAADLAISARSRHGTDTNDRR